MRFFVPFAEDDAQAERVYSSIAHFHGCSVTPSRISALRWEHNGETMEARVGQALPTYYRTGDEPVLAIIDAGHVYFVCTPNRGGARGEPVMAGKGLGSTPSCFD